MLPSILTFDFDLILGSFLNFCGPNGLFWGRARVRLEKLFWDSTHVVEIFLFTMCCSILSFVFDLIFFGILYDILRHCICSPTQDKPLMQRGKCMR